jgi:hypothetical protein
MQHILGYEGPPISHLNHALRARSMAFSARRHTPQSHPLCSLHHCHACSNACMRLFDAGNCSLGDIWVASTLKLRNQPTLSCAPTLLRQGAIILEGLGWVVGSCRAYGCSRVCGHTHLICDVMVCYHTLHLCFQTGSTMATRLVHFLEMTCLMMVILWWNDPNCCQMLSKHAVLPSSATKPLAALWIRARPSSMLAWHANKALGPPNFVR